MKRNTVGGCGAMPEYGPDPGGHGNAQSGFIK
jgi:hypothetical protein